MRKFVPLAACAALLLIPATSHAATNFGSRLNHDPANSGECTSFPNPCTIVSFIHPTDPNGDPYSGGAPVAGVITKFRIRGFGVGSTDPVDTKVTFRLARFVQATSGSDNAVATAAGIGPTVTVKAFPSNPETPTQEFSGRLPVSKGDHLAIDGTNIAATVNNSGDKFSYVFTPPLVQGQGPRGSTSSTGELLVAATIEPDADHDGFGDETQDKCLTQPNGGAACDNTSPVISQLRFKPSSFRALGSGPSLLGRTSGTKLSYRLSEPATTTFTVQRVLKGRRIRGRCRRATRRNKLLSRRKCKLYKGVRGSFTHTGTAGANSIRFTGRVGGKRLKVGSYRLVAVTVDPAGNKSAGKRRGFRIRR
jgi:hypothetical protein